MQERISIGYLAIFAFAAIVFWLLEKDDKENKP